MYDYFLFDLDGTLTDSAEGIINSVTYALNKFGITVEDREALREFIGPPLMDSYRKHFHMSEEQCKQAVVYYREYFAAGGLFENEVYAGIPELLAELKSRGKKIYLATSKPEVYAIQILEHFNLAQYFDFMGGASMDSSRSMKSDVVRYVLANASIPDLNKAVMIGDREYDITGAKDNCLHSIGVTYGFGNREELTTAGAEHIVDTATEILQFA